MSRSWLRPKSARPVLVARRLRSGGGGAPDDATLPARGGARRAKSDFSNASRCDFPGHPPGLPGPQSDIAAAHSRKRAVNIAAGNSYKRYKTYTGISICSRLRVTGQNVTRERTPRSPAVTIYDIVCVAFFFFKITTRRTVTPTDWLRINRWYVLGAVRSTVSIVYDRICDLSIAKLKSP